MKGDRTRQISHYWGYEEVLIDTAVFGTSVLGENKFTEITMGDSTLEARWDIDEVYSVFLPKLEATLCVEFNPN
jgi:hypothetical protein